MKFRDALMGLFIGDAMGVPYEFIQKNKVIISTREMIGGGSHGMPPGFWSDDSSMTLATIISITEQKKINYDDIMNKFVDWVEDGEYTPNGNTFDIGRTCLRAINNYHRKRTLPIKSGPNTISDNGNGSLMRILPLAYIAYVKDYNDSEIKEEVSKLSSLTHGHELSHISCFIYIKYILSILDGKSIREAYNDVKSYDYSAYQEDNLKCLKRILESDISKEKEELIHSTPYVVYTLEAVFWTLLNSESYEECIMKCIKLGHDTDTTSAIAGSIAGLYYGYESIPKQWRDTLVQNNYLKKQSNNFVSIVNNK